MYGTTEAHPKNYCMIKNSLVVALAKTRLSSYESCVLFAIIRKTYGFVEKNGLRKTKDWISLSQLESLTGIRKSHLSRTLGLLLSKGIITKGGKKIGINKNADSWVKLPKGVNTHHAKKLPKGVTRVTKGGNASYQRGGIQKKLIQKKLIQKKESIKKEKNNQISFKEKFITEYNQLLKRNFRMTPKLSAHLSARLKLFTEEQILIALRNMAKNSFYLGSNDRGWFAHPEFLLRNDEQIDRFLNVKETDGIQYAD